MKMEIADTMLDRSSNDRDGLVEIDGELFYRIDHLGEMAPFLVNLVSASDLWMFIGSNGALTAGRRNADNALFPYYTQDKLFDLAHTTGSVTKIWLSRSDWEAPRFWEPFRGESTGRSVRRLYKNVSGCRIIFEEACEALEARFRYEWTSSQRFGFVRRAKLENLGSELMEVRLLDGIQNLVPYGLDQAFVNRFSNLADAYKRTERVGESGLAVYYLSSIPTDRAEPSEGLKATVAWTPDADWRTILLSTEQMAQFRRGEALKDERDIRARRGAYLLEQEFRLDRGEARAWHIIADINKDAGEVEHIFRRLPFRAELGDSISKDVEKNSHELWRNVAMADGLQRSANPLRDARHFSNTLFNIMRGGVFTNGYAVEVSDYSRYLRALNRKARDAVAAQLKSLGSWCARSELLKWADGIGVLDLRRLTREYLPLTFSRRHGDPSRPWNTFSIETQDEQGNPRFAYQGNWRDIFQNWEPLGHSYPGYLQGMVSRFLNATTGDGYNPYKVSREGFEWERIEPDEAWSNIGYWGDHQLAYLVKLLEASDRFYPGLLAEGLCEDAYVYAHVPYRIRGFEDILRNPRESVDYDETAAAELERRAEELGADGKLLLGSSGQPVRANLSEKLMVPLLGKLSNFVPDGGIWMNTQRPEWNDANNALVGYGVSVVTLCYANRYLEFLARLFNQLPDSFEVKLDDAVHGLLEEQRTVFREFSSELHGGFGPDTRFAMLRRLGESGAAYREKVYRNQLGGERRSISKSAILRFLRLATEFVAKSIASNRREDGLYHSYNLLDFGERRDEARLERLYEMLEGQVAVLNSGRLSSSEAVSVAVALRRSRLYREDVGSYLLYPDRDLPPFMEKGILEPKQVERSPLLVKMLGMGDRRIVYVDEAGRHRFNGAFRNSADLKAALLRLDREGAYQVENEELGRLMGLFEAAFDHRRFTGRSGTFFAYEGLGSVYWHMVSKLVLAYQENCQRYPEKASLREAYYETLAGLGLGKSPKAYGAFPTDAYSHTPRHALAQQPGMTGQVKEDILSRWGELGLVIDSGCICFSPTLLRASEFLQEDAEMVFLDIGSHVRRLPVRKGQIGLTFCQTPMVIALGERREVRVIESGGRTESFPEWRLPRSVSRSIFEREGRVQRVEFTAPKESLAPA